MTKSLMDFKHQKLGSSVNGKQISYFYVSCRFYEQCTLSVSCHSRNHLYSKFSNHELLVFLVSIFGKLVLIV